MFKIVKFMSHIFDLLCFKDQVIMHRYTRGGAYNLVSPYLLYNAFSSA